MKILLFTISLLLSNICLGDKLTPYYASIKSSEVNVRKGPNTRYQIDWVFKNKGEPIEVIAKFEHWNKIKDITGDEGWVRSAMISKKRSAIITVKAIKKQKKQDVKKLFTVLHRKPDASSRVFAKIESSKRVFIEQCSKDWCKIKIKDTSGWIEKQHLWGVYINEEFK